MGRSCIGHHIYMHVEYFKRFCRNTLLPMLVDFNSTASCICLVARTRRQPHCCCCFTLLGLLLLQSLAPGCTLQPSYSAPGCPPYSATNRRCFLFISSCRSSCGWNSLLLVRGRRNDQCIPLAYKHTSQNWFILLLFVHKQQGYCSVALPLQVTYWYGNILVCL